MDFVVEPKGICRLGCQVSQTASLSLSLTREHNNCWVFSTSLSLSVSFLKIQMFLKFLLMKGKQ